MFPLSLIVINLKLKNHFRGKKKEKEKEKGRRFQWLKSENEVPKGKSAVNDQTRPLKHPVKRAALGQTHRRSTVTPSLVIQQSLFVSYNEGEHQSLSNSTHETLHKILKSYPPSDYDPNPEIVNSKSPPSTR
jgi:hypothetical protein